MASAKVLYVKITGVSSEILKNLVLAGVRSAICDGRPYPDAVLDTPSSFFPPSERTLPSNNTSYIQNSEKQEDERSVKRQRKMTVGKAMQPHVHELNPLLEECELNESASLQSIPDEYFSKFDVVIASQIGMEEAARISNATTSSNGKFFLVHVFGWYACALMDLGSSTVFRKELGKDKLSDVCHLSNYTSFKKLINVKLGDIKDRWHKDGPPVVWARYKSILHYFSAEKEWPSEKEADKFVNVTKDFLSEEGLKSNYLGGDNELKELANVAMAEMSPVCSVIGGVLGNEVIKILSGKGEPANNMVLFDGMDGGCKNFTIKEK